MTAHDHSTHPRRLPGGSPHADRLLSDDDFVRRQTDLFDPLVELVGSVDALWSLGTRPLPDEPFDWSAVVPSDRPFVAEVLRLADRCCDALLDVEYRTIARRLLARIAAHDPRPLRRHPETSRVAAALVWLTASTTGPLRGRHSASWIWRWFGVSNCSDRARNLYRAADVALDCDPDAHFRDPLVFGDVGLLHSHRRAAIVDAREQRREVALRRRTLTVDTSEGHVTYLPLTRPARALTAMKALDDDGRASVVIGFGDLLDDADYLSLTVPEAHDLAHMLAHALDDPIPYLGSS
jgi:hypothetical protein